MQLGGELGQGDRTQYVAKGGRNPFSNETSLYESYRSLNETFPLLSIRSVPVLPCLYIAPFIWFEVAFCSIKCLCPEPALAHTHTQHIF